MSTTRISTTVTVEMVFTSNTITPVAPNLPTTNSGGTVPPPTPAPPPRRRTYPKGVYTSFPGTHVPDAIKNNPGIIGLGCDEDWVNIEVSDGNYNWDSTDAQVEAAESVGLPVILQIGDGSWKTPQWLIDELKADSQTIPLLDTGSNHSTFCQNLDVPLYWNPRYHQKRLDLIAAAGARYSGDSQIMGTLCAFCNQHSGDWNVQDKIDTIACPDCPQPPPTQCGPVAVDQVQQWLDAGWTRAKIVQVGREIIDATATAFPRQNLKLAIGGFAAGLCSAGSAGVFSTAAQEILAYILTKSYKNRMYIQRNTVNTQWLDAQDLITHPPDPDSDRYIRLMVYDAAPHGGLQPEAALGNATDLQYVLTVMESFNPTFIELQPQDASNPDFYAMISAATVAIGGIPR